MARPRKEGLDYFPLDCDFWDDDKVEVIEAKHGIVGSAILIRLLAKIFKRGFFYEWTEREQILMAKKTGVSKETIILIVSDAVTEGFFSGNHLLLYGILTSRGIQKRFFSATDKRVRNVPDERFLVSATETIVSDGETRVSGELTGVSVNFSTQSKVKESKVKETPPSPSPETEPLGKSAEQIIANHDGSRTLSFEEILTVIEGQRDPEKHQNVSYNERGHLHKIYHADGLAEKLSIAVLKLSKTAWRGTLEQIEEVIQGKEPRSKHKTEHSAPQVPKAKPAKQAKNTGMTFEEAMNMTDSNSPLPF